jgi:hypothetical protein
MDAGSFQGPITLFFPSSGQNHYVCLMFSKQEAQQLKKEFWTAFGKSFPRKWILYDTKIKDMSFKFYADKKKQKFLWISK